MDLGSMPTGVEGGGLPPGAPPPGGMQAPPANLGPHTIPQSNPGNVMQAMQKLQAAAQMITEAIPQIPLGTPLHTKVMKIASELTKELGAAKDTMQQQVQTLLQAVQAAKAHGQNPQIPGPPPNQPPAMSPPGGAAMAA